MGNTGCCAATNNNENEHQLKASILNRNKVEDNNVKEQHSDATGENIISSSTSN